jgi:hypothetical protein
LIILGVRIAKSKNRSPHWMWFAIHPLGLVITLIVLASLKPLKECSRCAERVKSHARLCPYCGYTFSDMAGSRPVATGQSPGTFGL